MIPDRGDRQGQRSILKAGDEMDEKSPPLTSEVKETVGALTGDRQVEAEGRAEKRAANPDDPLGEVTDEVVDEETHEVRQEHDDIP
jgi:uncharacterized protein YjbJ (UPF0337 family)